MSFINQPPRLQLGDAPLFGFSGSETDQVQLVWQTLGSTSGDSYLVEYRELGGNWTTVSGVESDNTGVASRTQHEITLDGLDYDSTYEYRVTHTDNSGTQTSFDAQFQTRLAPDDTSEFTFVAYGDSAYSSNLDEFNKVQAQINENNPDFAVLLGDNAYNNGTHSEYDMRFETGTAAQSTLDWISSKIDYSTIGNHEAYSGGAAYVEGYSNPIHEAGVDAHATSPNGELSYSWDYGMAHFVTFDSNTLNNPSDLDAAMEYVIADLAASDAKWKIVYAHHPVGGAPDKSEGPEDDYWQEVVGKLYDAGVDLFLTGHSHTYSWSFPLTGHDGDEATFVLDEDQVYTQGDGVVQVVSGMGGKSIRSGDYDDDPFIAKGFTSSTDVISEYGFSEVTVSEDALVVDYVSSDGGRVIDSFTIEAYDGPRPQTVTFENGSAGYTGVVDTYIREASENNDYANATDINVDGSDGGGEVQALVRFDDLFGDGAGQIALGSDITSARLVLDVSNPGNAMNVYEMNRAWSENDSWNDLGDGIQTNGSEAATLVTNTGSVSTGELSIDVTSSLNAWLLDPASNNGWAFLPTGSNGVDFDSSETSSGPRLVVKYREEAGEPEPDTLSVAEDATVVFDALPEGSDLTIIGASSDQGDVSINGAGELVFAPDANYNGIATVSYTTNDAVENTIEVTVTSVNDAPIAQNDGSIATEASIPTSIASVLSNDTDVDGDSLFVSNAFAASGATVQVNAGGSLTYTADENFRGQDTITYTVSDGQGGTDTATISVEVSGPPPIQEISFQNGVNGYSGVMDTYIREADANSDYSAINEIKVDGSNGGGEVQGLLRFDDIIGDGADQIAAGSTVLSARLVVDVTNSGNALRLHDMLRTWDETDTWNDLGNGVQANGTDAVSGAVAATSGSVGRGDLELDVTDSLNAWLADPSSNHGWAILPTGNNGVDFQSSENSDGPRLIVTFREAEGDVNPTTPTVAEDNSLVFDVLDAEDDRTISLASSDEGTVSVNADGSLTFVPDVNYNGTATVSYTTSDGAFNEVEVIVTPVNDAPLALNDGSVSADADTPTFIPSVLANDSDIDGDSLTVVSASAASGATVQINSGGSLTYTADEDFRGEDTITYTISDGQGGSDTASLDVTVTGPAPIQQISFQNGVNGYNGVVDTYIREASANSDYDTARSLNVDGSDGGGDVQGLVRFDDIIGDGADQIALGAQILSANLVVDVSNPGSAIDLHTMVQNWDDTDSWNDFGNGIQTNGSEASTAITTSTNSVSRGELTLDVTDSLSDWLENPSSNNGWVLMPTGNNGIDFDSSETSSGPRLEVTYRDVVGNGVAARGDIALDDVSEGDDILFIV